VPSFAFSSIHIAVESHAVHNQVVGFVIKLSQSENQQALLLSPTYQPQPELVIILQLVSQLDHSFPLFSHSSHSS